MARLLGEYILFLAFVALVIAAAGIAAAGEMWVIHWLSELGWMNQTLIGSLVFVNMATMLFIYSRSEYP